RLKPDITLDHEAEPELKIEVTAIDQDGARYSESFEVKVADINEGPEDVTLSNTAVAENAAGAVVGKISVVDPDAGDSHSFEVSDDRFEVVDGALRLKPDMALDHEAEPELKIEVTAIDQDGARYSESFAIETVPVPQLDIATGFHAQYFDMNETLRKLDDVDWDAPPTHEEVVSDIDYQNGRGSFWEDGSTDTFGVQINGSVSVTEGGEFEFFLGGDDGATLFVNGAPVIDNDGLHGFRTRTGSVELEPGTHHIEVRYFENYGHAGLKLEWDGPGTDGRELVAAPGVQDAQTVNGTALNVELSTDSLGDNTSLTIKGLPEGTLIEAGEQMQSVGADGSADITGWDTSLLNVTPPVDFLGQVTAEVVATVKTSSGQNASSTESLEFQVNSAELTPPGGEMVGGFHASYFDVNHSLRKLDDIDWSSDPTHQEFVADINYENGRGSFWENGSTDTFGAKITGQIEIETGGAYDFFLGGDDGAIMLINGEPVIDNDGLHGFRTREGEIELEPGVYDIEVRYFENYGHAGLKLEWDGPDTDGRELLQAKPELAVEENGTLEVGIELNAGSENASVELSGLPIDTIIISGEEAAVVSDEPLDLSGWNLDLLEISPPPNFEGEVRGEITFSDTAFNGQSVSSSEPFSFTVGEPDSVSGPTAQDDMIQSDDAQNGSERQNNPYYDGESDGEADDVMTEPAQVQENRDAADLCMETHETAEW
ncbi:MAG: PA14 domain-containing protein, partial [Pseudomonadota bacterium]